MSVVDTLISRLARRQHGVVALWQLAALGIEDSAVRRRVADGRLRRIHRGVYAVGPIGRKGYWMAAVLACSEGALLVTAMLPPCGGSEIHPGDLST